MQTNKSVLDVFTSEILFYAAPPTERLSGSSMSDISIAIPLKNNLPENVTVSPSSVRIVFKDQAGRIFFIDEVFSFIDHGVKLILETGKKKVAKFKLIVSQEIYQRLVELRQMWLLIGRYPPLGLYCNEEQGDWRIISEYRLNEEGTVLSESAAASSVSTHTITQEEQTNTTDTPEKLENKEDFKFICPHCGQHFLCPPECDGVACECPTCGKTIYPERPKEEDVKNSCLIISYAPLTETLSSTLTSYVKDLIDASALSAFIDKTDEVFDGGEEEVEDGEDFEEDQEEVDWDAIDDSMLNDMNEAMESIVDDTIYDLPEKAQNELEQAAESAWDHYKSSLSFQSEFESWCEDNGYEDDDLDYAEDCMKDEWIDEWKIDNEDEWSETWCNEHVDELKENWHKEKEFDWMKEWARDNAEIYDVTAEQILEHWGMTADTSSSKETTTPPTKITEETENKNINTAIDNGDNMKNKIPVETQFKTITGAVTAIPVRNQEGDKVVFYTDFTCPNYSQGNFRRHVGIIVYDVDGDICARDKKGLYWFDDPVSVDIAPGAVPARVVLREE